MKVLIAPQFNAVMQGLAKEAQIEVSALYNFASISDKEHVVSSSLTKITSEHNDIFTLRGTTVRIFCTFSYDSGNEVLVFLDVKVVRDISTKAAKNVLKGEVTLFGNHGEPIAYIEDNKEKAIFSFNGEPLAYIDEDQNIYGFNGKHLGWFEDQIVLNHEGLKVGFTKTTSPAFTQFEPFKGFKQFKPFKSFKEFAPFKPFKSQSVSETGLLEFLKKGRI